MTHRPVLKKPRAAVSLGAAAPTSSETTFNGLDTPLGQDLPRPAP